MNEIINENKIAIVSAIVIFLLYNNREFVYSIFSKVFGVFSIFSWKKREKTASQDDRKNLYECLIQLQDYLAICGTERSKMDSMTLEEVGRLTVSATTPLKPSLDVSIDKEKLQEPIRPRA